MKIIRSRAEFIAYYQETYKGYKPDNYPKNYPCVVWKEDIDGGIGGDWVKHNIIPIPKDVDEKSFLRGIKALHGG